VRTLDVLDIHYYPEGLYNEDAAPATAAHRLRSTRSLWDKTYVDQSWIGEPVNLISRMKELLVEHYPGTQLGISEWNWGADKTINGALAIADVLGIFGREDLYLASCGSASLYRYSAANPAGIAESSIVLDQSGAVTLPAYSISLLVIEAHKQ
jgi:hypothetical protein